MRRSNLSSFLLATLCLAVPCATAQEGRGDPRKAIASFERYLERKPFHDWAFDKLVEAAVQVNALGELVESYEERARAAPEDAGVRVVLARLYARADQYEQAIETLSGVRDESAALAKLIGQLELERGRAAEAIAALERAAALTEDREALEAIHKLCGEAQLVAGDRAAAHAAFRALAELDPASFHLRLEAAETLALHGLHAEALVEFEVAEALAEGDVPRRCRVLSEIGRLHEALSRGEEAVVVYRRALNLMARGNWLKRDLYERILALHKRTGQLEVLLERAAADAAAATQDLDTREFHARVLVELARRDEARAVLEAARSEFPGDLALSRSLVDVLRDLEDADAVITEYQRILTERPEELELYLELGRAFAAEGRFEQAKRQWAKSLEQRLTDPGLCLRLAQLYAFYDQADDAVLMYEKAITLEPSDLSHYADLAAFLRAHERGAEALGVLERAEGPCAGSARLLEDLSALWSEYGDAARARASIVQALEVARTRDGAVDEPRLLQRRAELDMAAGDMESAAATLHRAINLSRESNLRRTAVDRLLRIFYRDDRVEDLIALEEAELESGSTEPAPYLVLGRVYAQQREPDKAIAILQRLVELDPDGVDARHSLARLHEQQGDWDLALGEYEALMERNPATRRKHLKAVAQIHLSRYDQDAAFACYEEILAAAPDNPAAFTEVAEAYERIGLHDESLECLRQAVRLGPDDGRARLKLAEGYRSVGEVARAEREILAATADGDAQVRADARKAFYNLVVDAGRVEGEIAALRTRVEENPYDVSAPLTLTDIYVRELEYQLALDMLEKLLAYQPKQPRLLRERARMLALMDRHDEAIADLETLWKLPDADRLELALEIADAALEQGDRARAAQVLANVNDVRRVASLYRKKELWDEAIGAVEGGLARTPGDPRLMSDLARMHESRGDDDAAIAVIETLLETQPDSWRTIRRLGALYHARGDKQNTIRLGRRLFALIRVEDAADADADEDEAPATARRRHKNLSAWTSSRVRDIQTYFRDKNLNSEFALIGAEEVLLQPTNHTLFQTIVSALQREDGQGARVHELIDAVRAATERTGRVDESTTLRSFLRSLESQRLYAYRSDGPYAEARAAELTGRIEAGAGTLRDHLELGGIRSTLKQSGELLAALEAGVAAYPESSNLLTGLAATLVAEKRYADALPVYERLGAVLEVQEPDREAEILREKRDRASRRSVLDGFPLHVRRRVSDEDVRRFQDLTRGRSFYSFWGLGRVQQLDGMRLAYARCLGKADRVTEAKVVLAALVDADSDSFTDLITLAGAYYDLELFPEAQALFERVARVEAELTRDPLFGFNRSWERYFTAPMSKLARIHERAGEPFLAYDLMRSSGDAAAGELVLTSADALEEATRRYRDRVADEARQLEALPDDEADSAAWRDASVRLAEVHQIAKRWDAALAVYEEVERRRPDDFAIVSTIAQLHERAGRWDAAVATHWRTIERKRALNQSPYRPEVPAGRVLTPVRPKLAKEEDNYTWNNLLSNFRYSGRSSGSSGSGARQRFDYREDYVRILKLELDRGQVTRAAELMRELGRQDARTFTWLGYYLADVVERYRLGPAGIPILRTIHAQDATNVNIALLYGRALVAGRKWDEARRVLGRVRDREASNSYYGRQADELLSTLDAREGGGARETTESLASAVEGDPKNVKARMKLADRLFSERRFDEALAHAREARELAPHKDDVATFLRHCLQATGNDAELEELMIASIDEITDDSQRLETAARVANWMWARGEHEAVYALFERAEARQSRGTPRYSSASWYAEKGDLGRARDVIAAAIERTDARYRSRVRPALAAVQLALGDPFAHMDTVWDESYTKATAFGVKSKLLTELATPLRGSTLLEDGAALVERCAARGAEAGTPQGSRQSSGQSSGQSSLQSSMQSSLQGALYAAAVEAALGDLAAAERRLAAEADPVGETRFLYPNLVSLARARGDLEGALAWLEELREKDVGSESATVRTALGSLSEKDALRAEIGGLRLELGDRAGALEVWDEMFDPDDARGKERKARLLESHGLYAEAADLMRQFLEEEGERNAQHLDFLAGIELHRGDPEAAIELWRKALILSAEDSYSAPQYRSRLLDAHRIGGTLGQMVADLEARAAADPDDMDVKKLLVRMYAEDGREDAAIEMLEGMLERPGMAKAVLPTLIQRALVAGDEELAVAHYRRLLDESMDEWERRNQAQAFASLLFHRGEVDEALAVLRAGHTDPDGIDALTDAAYRLESVDRLEEALESWKRAAQLQPENSRHESRVLTLLSRLERHAEARDRILEYLADPERRRAAGAVLNYYPAISEKTDEKERLAQALASDPGDPTTRLLAAVAAENSKEDGGRDVAIEHYLALVELDPRDQVVLARLRSAYVSAERWTEALEIIERMLPMADREQQLPGLEQVTSASSLRSLRAQMYRRMGDIDAAEASLRDRTGLRNVRVNAPRFEVGSTPSAVHTAVLNMYRGLEDWDKCLELYRQAAAVPSANTDRQDGGYYEMRFRTGEEEAVLEDLWSLVENPGGALFGERTHFTFYGTAQNLLRNSSVLSLLVRLNVEHGTIDDLVERLRVARERDPDDSQLAELYRIAAEVGERWELVLESSQAELAEDPFHPELLMNTARLLSRLGRYEEAIPLLERSRSIYRGQSYNEVTGWTYHERLNPFGQTGPVRFGFSVGNASVSYGGGSGWSSYGSGSEGWGGPTDAARRHLIVAYHGAGRHEEALALEEREEAGRRAQKVISRSSARDALVPLFRAARLLEHAERRKLAELEYELGEVREADVDKEEAQRTSLRRAAWEELGRMWREAGDEERARSYAARLLELSDAGLAKIEADAELDEKQRRQRVAYWHRNRAKVLAEVAGDIESARAEFAQYIEQREPVTNLARDLPLAWLHLHLGENESALAIFRAAKEERAISRGYWGRDLDYGLGLCLAAGGDLQAAHPLLRRALAAEPQSEHAAAARAALE